MLNLKSIKRKYVPKLFYIIYDCQPFMQMQIKEFLMENVEFNILIFLCYDISNFPRFIHRIPGGLAYFNKISQIYNDLKEINSLSSDIFYAIIDKSSIQPEILNKLENRHYHRHDDSDFIEYDQYDYKLNNIKFIDDLKVNFPNELLNDDSFNKKEDKTLYLKLYTCSDKDYANIRLAIFKRDLYDHSRNNYRKKRCLYSSVVRQQFSIYLEQDFKNNYFYEEFEFAKYDKNDFGYYIMSNDVDGFVSLLNYFDISHKNHFKIEFKDGIEFFNRWLSKGIVQYVTLLECSAFYGSVQIFKYLLMNGISCRKSKNIRKCAVAGGNYEIIRLLVQKNVVFNDNCYAISIIYHHNELSEWIKLNYNIKCKYDFGKISKHVMNFNNYFLKIAIIIEAINQEYQDIVIHFLNNTTLSINDIIKIYTLSAKCNLMKVIHFIDRNTNWLREVDQTSFINKIFKKGYKDMNLDTCLYIIQEKQIDIKEFRFKNNLTFLHLTASCEFEIFAYFITFFFDFDIQDNNGDTPLFYAVSSEKEKNVRFLIKHHVNPNIKNKKGKTCDFYAQNNDISTLLNKYISEY